MQERELLQINLDNALQKAEEVSRRQGDSLGTKYFSEFPMTEIKEAAWNFDPSLKIGEGGCGSVYRGFLRQTLAAINMMTFRSLQGGCVKQDCLGSSNRAKQLSWRARIRIATELCSVLAFLHSCKPHSIVHGDVKQGNILLDAHLASKLSDLGVCRMLYSCSERSSDNTTVVYETDVPMYLSGIARDVRKAISEGTLGAILDPLAGDWPYFLAEELTHSALRCCEMNRRNRPDLRSDLWMVLQFIGASGG
ncbi:hypothetical protein NL676_010634 [Syzygium grande]|nr:hypothetical protein NL676_010634 [Syzygium grande]